MALSVLIAMYLSWAYGAMMSHNKVNVDVYTGTPASFKDRVSVSFGHWCVQLECSMLP